MSPTTGQSGSVPPTPNVEIKSPDDSLAFAKFLARHAPPGSYIAISRIRLPSVVGEKPKPATRFVEIPMALGLVPDIVKEFGRNSNLYIRCTILSHMPKEGRGSDDDTLGTSVLWADIDATPIRSVYQIIDHLKKFEKPPSWVNLSGNGVHAYWSLTRFITDHKEIRGKNKWLSTQLNADDCWDLSHILRIPGSYNLKDPKEPKKVVIAPGFASELSYEHTDFPTVDVESAQLKEQLLVELPEDFLKKIPPGLVKRIVEGPDHAQDRSSNDWFIARTLHGMGFNKAIIFTVLSHPTWASGEKSRQQGLQYAARTAEMAFVKPAQRQELADFDKDTSNGAYPKRLLAPILQGLLFYRGEDGELKKKRVLQGEDLVIPVARHLNTKNMGFFVDRQEDVGYIISEQGRSQRADSADRMYRDWIQEISGFTEEEQEHRILRSGLASYARREGSPISTSAWTYLKSSTEAGQPKVFRMLLDPFEGITIRVVEGSSPEVVPNGTDNLLLKRSILNDLPIKYDPDANPYTEFSRFNKNFVRVVAASHTAQSILACYVLAAPLCAGVQTLPIMHVVGPSGGGKTQTLGLASTVLYGSPKLLNATKAAIYREASREIFLPFDDYTSLPNELQQLLLTAATGIIRQKSGPDGSSVISQVAHVLIGLTSISELEDEALRRRALVLFIDKDQFPAKDYTLEHWRLLAAYRSNFWSAYINWIADRFLKVYDFKKFVELSKETEKLIPLDIFRGLAPYLTLMWLVGSHINPYLEMVETQPLVKSHEATIRDWINELRLGDVAEIEERQELLSAIRMVFEWHSTLPGTFDLEDYRNAGFRLHQPDSEHLSDGWTGLEGTASEWMVTLKEASRGGFVCKSEHKLGFMFRRLLKADFDIDSKTRQAAPVDAYGFRFIKVANAGPRRCNRGWRILVPPQSNS